MSLLKHDQQFTQAMSDWQTTCKPAAAKLHKELLKSHGAETGAMVEALEIARRTAEIEQTTEDWVARHCLEPDSAIPLLNDAKEVFMSLCGEFGPQRAVHVLTALEREHSRQRWGIDMKAWRKRGGMSVEQAATELNLCVEDIECLERGDFIAGPETMRRVRPALQRVRGELGKT